MVKKRVLIVEDELIKSILLKKMMIEMGFKVVGKVKTGENAIQIAKETQPDLITMDIFLQDDIDGIEATKEIQKENSVPVIYISSNTDSYNFERAKHTSYIDFLPTPVNKTTLQGILAGLREEFIDA